MSLIAVVGLALAEHLQSSEVYSRSSKGTGDDWGGAAIAKWRHVRRRGYYAGPPGLLPAGAERGDRVGRLGAFPQDVRGDPAGRLVLLRRLQRDSLRGRGPAPFGNGAAREPGAGKGGALVFSRYK